MAWFSRVRKELPLDESERQHDNRVEVVVSKEANKEIIRQAHAANKQLNDLLKQNHFTIKIFLAARGGKPRTAHK
jgi:hypothetical protein